MIQANVVATSGRAIEAAGDVDVLLLDKTGTITLGNRQAAKFYPAPGVAEKDLADAAQLASLADETPEGRSIVVLAKSYGIRARDLNELSARFIPFSAQTRMSGIDIGERQIRKGAPDAIDAWLKAHEAAARQDRTGPNVSALPTDRDRGRLPAVFGRRPGRLSRGSVRFR